MIKIIKTFSSMIKDVFKRFLNPKVKDKIKNRDPFVPPAHFNDPDFDVPNYIEIDMSDPWKDYLKNQVTCKNGLVKEEVHTLPNDLAEFAGPMGDNIWIGKKVGTGKVTLVGPKYYYENKKYIYTTIDVKVYNSESDTNTYIGK